MMSGSIFFVALLAQADGARVMRSDDISPWASSETTVNGCACSSACGTSIGAYYKCDWCNVPSTCSGKRWTPLRGNYDFCAYRQVDAYEGQSFKQKTSTLWSQVMATAGKSQPLGGIVDTVVGVMKSSMRTTFDAHRDVMPPGRVKPIHVQGVVCQFDLSVSGNSPYTGLLASGTTKGLIRLGSAFPAPRKFPGIAVKFLRSGHDSANFVALRAAGPSVEGNMFDHDLSNHVAPPDILAAMQKFQQASDCMSKVGLSDLCKYNNNGQRSSNVKFPYQLFFESHSDTTRYNGDVIMTSLDKIPAGTGLYKVYALESPSASKAYLGTITTTTACVRSMFGDQQLFFEHQRMEEDFKLRPDWMAGAEEEYCQPSNSDVSEWQCKYNQ